MLKITVKKSDSCEQYHTSANLTATHHIAFDETVIVLEANDSDAGLRIEMNVEELLNAMEVSGIDVKAYLS